MAIPSHWVLFGAIAAIALLAACVERPAADGQGRELDMRTTTAADDDGSPASGKPDEFADDRKRMVRVQLAARDIHDRRVLDAMRRVPRHLFVPDEMQQFAYDDRPLPIGYQQTISQPYIVALMTQLAQTKPESRVLDVGTGSGYQAAVLAELCQHVYGIEIVPPLAETAAKRLREQGYANVTVRCGDGYRGWPEHAPFDAIILAAAPEHIPPALVDQLAPGGRLVLPVGDRHQELVVVEKQPDGTTRQRTVTLVAFVPMTGEAQNR
jgi:protein-L-isoaspartate(D-aspartate) O-methyltransferase